MNVRLPFADEPWAYGAITLFTLIIVTVVYVIVRRMRF
jgi:Mg2+ and Co2+ transporter CorA